MRKVREEYTPSSGYAASNIINLLSQLEIDLAGYDFSHLTVWQAYLQDVNLHEANFAQADLSKSVFAETLSDVIVTKFSPDRKCLATGDGTGVVQIWCVADGKKLLTFTAHTSWIWSIAYSPDGTILASGGASRNVKLWNAHTGKFLKVLKGHENWVQSVAFSPDGKTLASSSIDGTVRLWSVASGQCLGLFEHPNMISSVAFSPYSQMLATACKDQTVRLWDIATKCCAKVLQGHANYVYSIAYAPCC